VKFIKPENPLFKAFSQRAKTFLISMAFLTRLNGLYSVRAQYKKGTHLPQRDVGKRLPKPQKKAGIKNEKNRN